MGLRKPRFDTAEANAGQGLFADQPAFTSFRSITLRGAVDIDGFRQAARRLMAEQIRPECVGWHSGDDTARDLFASANQDSAEALGEAGASGGRGESDAGQTPVLTVPAEFLQLCQTVILHSDAGRFGLLYRLLWRLRHEPALRHDPLDADRVQARHMAQAVQRDVHKMKAFVRFRTVQDEAFKTRPAGGPMHVAWFEPEHHIVQAIAPFFAKRFTQMRWAVLTPECSVEWNGATLRFGPGAAKADAPPADAGEHLWLTYYRSTFNPARLKLKAMQKEMPRRYWKNLPEAELISGLAAGACERSAAMIDQPPTLPRRRIPAPRLKAVPSDAARSAG